MTTDRGQPTVTLDQAGPMPLVGLGTWQMTGTRCQAAVRSALEVGSRHIDTATIYRNEGQVGRAIRDSGVPGEQVFITTKLPPGAAGRARRTLDDSLRALGMDYVDLWLVHWPPRGRALVSTWEQLLAARDQGLARAVGVSNYRTAQLDELIAATGAAPQVNQIPWAPTLDNAALLAEHRRRGVALEGYSPFKNTDLGHPVLVEIAARHAVTPAQVVVRWHIDHEVVVIPKSATPERIAANFDVFGFSLNIEELGRIDGLSTTRRRWRFWAGAERGERIEYVLLPWWSTRQLRDQALEVGAGRVCSPMLFDRASLESATTLAGAADGQQTTVGSVG